MSQSGDVWGLISDVHGNRPALERALETLEQAGANRLGFLGDYLGRGDSDGCVARIRELADVAILGNRDLDWQDRVAVETKRWVLGLPRTAQVGSLLLSHGDSRLTPTLNTAQIGRGFDRAWQAMHDRDARVWAFGHSHQARLWRKLAAADPPEALMGDTVDIDRRYRYCLNVGTTGLPFPRKGGPSVALVDFRAGRIRRIALRQV